MLDAHGQPEVCLLSEVDRKTPAEIAREFWQTSRQLHSGTSSYQQEARLFRRIPGWFRGPLFRLMLRACNHRNWPAVLWGQRSCSASTMVSYLGHRGRRRCGCTSPAVFPRTSPRRT